MERPVCRGNDPRLRNDGLRGEAKLLAKIDRFLLYRAPIYSMRSPRKLQN